MNLAAHYRRCHDGINITNTQQQEITARTTGSQNTTRTQQQETVAATVVAGLRTHVFQVELGRNIAAIERATNKHVTLEKGTRISIFKAETLFDPFFVVVVHDIIYRVLQADVNDGQIRSIVPKRPN